MINIEIEIQKTIKRLFETDNGKKVLDHLIEEYVMKSPFSPDISVIQLSYAEGRSDIVRLLSQITKSTI